MKWDEWRGFDDDVHNATMWIKRLIRIPIWKGKSIRVDLHKMLQADHAFCYHTHPGWAIRFILKGGYIEMVTEKWLHGNGSRWTETWRPGDFGLVSPDYCHRIHALLSPDLGVSYSLWIRFPKIKDVELIGKGWSPELLGVQEGRKNAPTTQSPSIR